MKLGDQIQIVAVLKREREHGGRKFWKRVELAEPRTVLFLGKRTLANGKLVQGQSVAAWSMEPEYYEYFVTDEFVKAVLVVHATNVNPYYAVIE